MTLNITLLTPDHIFQAADYRLSTNGIAVPEPSTKVVLVCAIQWTGFITYTGLGRVGRKHTSALVQDWISDIDQNSFATVVDTLQQRGNRWLQRTAPDQEHTFIVAGFVADSPTAVMLSNFQRWWGSRLHTKLDELIRSPLKAGSRSLAMITGTPDVVTRQERRLLESQSDRYSSDPARVRRAIADAVKNASTRAPAVVSEDCIVYSQDRHGRGHQEAFGSSRTDFRASIPAALRHQILDLVGPHASVKSSTFARFPGGDAPPAKCRLDIAPPKAGYEIVELASGAGRRATPRARNVDGIAVGEASEVWQGPHQPCKWSSDFMLDVLPRLSELGGSAAAINSDGMIIGSVTSADNTSHACAWSSTNSLDPLEEAGSTYSGANDVNNSNVIAGFVSIGPREGGQQHHRPAVWRGGRGPKVLRDLGKAWGEAVCVGDDDSVVIRVHTRSEVECGRWDAQELVMMGLPSAKVFAFYPVGRTGSDVIVGTAITRPPTSERRISLCSPTGRWTVVESDQPREVVAVNWGGDLVGYAIVDHYEVPWIYRAKDARYDFLPSVFRHQTRPSSISDDGWIVGSASADDCCHPVAWQPT